MLLEPLGKVLFDVGTGVVAIQAMAITNGKEVQA